MLTTCATDYVTWRNELAPGVETVNGVPVRRFPREARARSARVRPPVGPRLRAAAFARRRARLARRGRADEPGAHRLPRAARAPTTTTACSSATATTTRTTARARPRRAPILVPTAERDAAIGLSIFPPVFRGVRALMYNSPEERAMIQAVSGNERRARRRRRRRLGRAAEPAAGPVPAEVQHPRAVRRLRRAGSMRTRAARSCSSSSRATCAEPAGELSLVLDRQLAAADSRRTRASATSASSTTRTSSTRWPPPIC